MMINIIICTILLFDFINSEDNILFKNQLPQYIYNNFIPNNMQLQNIIGTYESKPINFQNSIYKGINIQPGNLQYEPSLNNYKKYDNNFISYNLPQSYNNILLTDDVNELLKKGSYFINNGDYNSAIEYYVQAIDADDEYDNLKTILDSITINFGIKGDINILESSLQEKLNNKIVRKDKAQKFLKKIKKIVMNENDKENKKFLINTKKQPNIIENILPLKKNNEKFSEWIMEKKIKINNKLNIEINMPFNFTIKAKKDIQNNENLIQIPKDMIISHNHEVIKPLCEKIREIKEFNKNFDKICLSVFILCKDKQNNFYLKNFKKSNYDNFPVFYKEKEFKPLKGTYFLTLINARKRLFYFEYQKLIEFKIISSDLEFKSYVKSRLYVISKNLSLKSGHSVMMPIINNIKYSSESNVGFKYKNGNFTLYAKRDISQNEELFLKIGNLSNYNNLLYYGFTKMNNSVKSEVFLDLKITDKSNISYIEGIYLRSDYNINKILSFFRNIGNGKIEVNYTKPYSIDNEYKSIHLFKKSLKIMINKFKTNYISDCIVLKYKNLTQNMINIYRVMIEEKKIVEEYFKFARFFEKIFDNIIKGKINSLKYISKIKKKDYYKKYYYEIKEILKDNITLENEIIEQPSNLNLTLKNSFSDKTPLNDQNINNISQDIHLTKMQNIGQPINPVNIVNIVQTVDKNNQVNTVNQLNQIDKIIPNPLNKLQNLNIPIVKSNNVQNNLPANNLITNKSNDQIKNDDEDEIDMTDDD